MIDCLEHLDDPFFLPYSRSHYSLLDYTLMTSDTATEIPPLTLPVLLLVTVYAVCFPHCLCRSVFTVYDKCILRCHCCSVSTVYAKRLSPCHCWLGFPFYALFLLHCLRCSGFTISLYTGFNSGLKSYRDF